MNHPQNTGYYKDTDRRDYVRARHLDVRAGWWFTEDPIRFYGNDVNLYRYAGAMPISISDPSGLLRFPMPNNYGNYCDAFVNGGTNAPIDDLDATCQRHDNCLSWENYCKPGQIPKCQTEFCRDAIAVASNGGCRRAKYPALCCG